MQVDDGWDQKLFISLWDDLNSIFLLDPFHLVVRLSMLSVDFLTCGFTRTRLIHTRTTRI